MALFTVSDVLILLSTMSLLIILLKDAAGVVKALLELLDRFKKLCTILKRFFDTITSRWGRAKRISVFQVLLDNATRVVDEETGGVFPYRIELGQSATGIETDVTDHVIKVKLPPHEFAQNLAMSIFMVIDENVLTYLTHSLSEDVKVPLKLALTRKILREMGTTGPLKCFFRNLLIPKLEGKPNAKKNYVKLIKLDEKGWMTRIVLRVTNDLDKKSEREGCLLEVDQELNAFIQYAHNLSKSGRPFKNTLDFVGRNIKVSTIFVGNAITKLYGLEPYISRIKQCLEEGARLIFVASIATSESNNISVAEEIVKCNFEGLVSVEEAKAYTLRSNPELQGYCAALRFS